MYLKCNKCSDSGAIVAIKKQSKEYYAFRCECGTRLERNKSYPVWNDKLAVEYEVDFITVPYSDPKMLAANNKPDEDLY